MKLNRTNTTYILLLCYKHSSKLHVLFVCVFALALFLFISLKFWFMGLYFAQFVEKEMFALLGVMHSAIFLTILSFLMY